MLVAGARNALCLEENAREQIKLVTGQKTALFQLFRTKLIKIGTSAIYERLVVTHG